MRGFLTLKDQDIWSHKIEIPFEIKAYIFIIAFLNKLPKG